MSRFIDYLEISKSDLADIAKGKKIEQGKDIPIEKLSGPVNKFKTRGIYDVKTGKKKRKLYVNPTHDMIGEKQFRGVITSKQHGGNVYLMDALGVIHWDILKVIEKYAKTTMTTKVSAFGAGFDENIEDFLTIDNAYTNLGTFHIGESYLSGFYDMLMGELDDSFLNDEDSSANNSRTPYWDVSLGTGWYKSEGLKIVKQYAAIFKQKTKMKLDLKQDMND